MVGLLDGVRLLMRLLCSEGFGWVICFTSVLICVLDSMGVG